MPATMSKAEANYREADTRAQRCWTCSMYVSDGTCTLVRGPIKPDDVCDHWEPDA